MKAAAVGCADKSGDVRAAGNTMFAQALESFGNDVMNASRSLEGPLKAAASEAIQKAGGGRLSPTGIPPPTKANAPSRLPSRESQCAPPSCFVWCLT